MHHGLYHCCNWVFKVIEKGEKIFRVDTHWAGEGNVTIEVTDDNINDFTLVIRQSTYKEISPKERDYFNENVVVALALNSKGWGKGASYFVPINEEYDRGRIISHLYFNIKFKRRELEYAESRLKLYLEKGII